MCHCECKSTVMQSRAKGSIHRRPQSRAARQQAAQRSVEDREDTLGGDVPGPNPSLSGLVLPLPDKSSQMHASPTLPNSSAPAALPASSPAQPSLSEISPRPSVLTLPVSKSAGKTDSSKDSLSTKVLPSSDEDDLFGSDSLFEATSVTNTPSTTQTAKTAQPQASSGLGLKKDEDKSTPTSIFDDNTDDLFQKVKPRSTAKKAKASSFLEDDDDDEDIFGVSNSSTPSSTSSKEIKNSSSYSKQDIFQVPLFYIDDNTVKVNLCHHKNLFHFFPYRLNFLCSQDEVATVPKIHKVHKEKTIDASLFDDDIDIFADLTDTLKPKQKSKTKGETKSIFDDYMGKQQ